MVESNRMFDVMEAPGPEDQNGMTMLAGGAVMQQVRAPFTTAVMVQRPRALRDVQKRLVEEANLAGEDFYYGWGAGDNAIEGPSVKLALAAARCYGNCAVIAQPVQEMKDSWIFTSSFIDLETGFTIDRQFRQSKASTVAGKMDAARKEDIRFQVGQSKAARNVVLNAIPSGLVDLAMQAAKKGVREKIERYIATNGLPAAIDLVLGGLLKVGVKKEAVLSKLGVLEVKGITVEHLVILRGDLAAIDAGQERAADLFPAANGTPAPTGKPPTGRTSMKDPPKADERAPWDGGEAPAGTNGTTNGAAASETAAPTSPETPTPEAKKAPRAKKADASKEEPRKVNGAQLARIAELQGLVQQIDFDTALMKTGKKLNDLTGDEADAFEAALRKLASDAGTGEPTEQG